MSWKGRGKREAGDIRMLEKVCGCAAEMSADEAVRRAFGRG